MKITNKYIFFWKEWLSNFHRCNIPFEGNIFTSSEQLFMYLKADFFKDNEAKKRILEAKSPQEAKNIGRQVKNYDNFLWDKHRYNAMYCAVSKKFENNPYLIDQLLNPKFENKIFVEASPFDRIWGIGYDEYNIPQNEKLWGRNLLGIILTEIRKNLKTSR